MFSSVIEQRRRQAAQQLRSCRPPPWQTGHPLPCWSMASERLVSARLGSAVTTTCPSGQRSDLGAGSAARPAGCGGVPWSRVQARPRTPREATRPRAPSTTSADERRSWTAGGGRTWPRWEWADPLLAGCGWPSQLPSEESGPSAVHLHRADRHDPVEHGSEPQHLLAVQQLAISQCVLQHGDGSLDRSIASHDRAAGRPDPAGHRPGGGSCWSPRRGQLRRPGTLQGLRLGNAVSAQEPRLPGADTLRTAPVPQPAEPALSRCRTRRFAGPPSGTPGWARGRSWPGAARGSRRAPARRTRP